MCWNRADVSLCRVDFQLQTECSQVFSTIMKPSKKSAPTPPKPTSTPQGGDGAGSEGAWELAFGQVLLRQQEAIERQREICLSRYQALMKDWPMPPDYNEATALPPPPPSFPAADRTSAMDLSSVTCTEPSRLRPQPPDTMFDNFSTGYVRSTCISSVCSRLLH